MRKRNVYHWAERQRREMLSNVPKIRWMVAAGIVALIVLKLAGAL